MLVVSAPEAAAEDDSQTRETRRVLDILLEELPLKQAAHLAARITGARKNAVYELALTLKRQD